MSDHNKILFKRLGDKAVIPFRRHNSGDVGYDLTVIQEYNIVPGDVIDMSTQIAICLPDNTWAEIVGRSSTVRKWGLDIIHGVIDNGFTGELYVGVRNFGKRTICVPAGVRLAQLVLRRLIMADWEEVDELPTTDRGSNGFGSTGT